MHDELRTQVRREDIPYPTTSVHMKERHLSGQLCPLFEHHFDSMCTTMICSPCAHDGQRYDSRPALLTPVHQARLHSTSSAFVASKVLDQPHLSQRRLRPGQNDLLFGHSYSVNQLVVHVYVSNSLLRCSALSSTSFVCFGVDHAMTTYLNRYSTSYRQS